MGAKVSTCSGFQDCHSVRESSLWFMMRGPLHGQDPPYCYLTISTECKAGVNTSHEFAFS